MTTALTLYYAPDNASLCVRLALLQMNIPFQTALVDRRTAGQTHPDYLTLNPNGQIPTLVTPAGPIYETGAILLWLADQNPGTAFPAIDDPARAAALKWLFWIANTLHPALRMSFYPDKYIAADSIPQLLQATYANLANHMRQLEDHADWLDAPDGILACYLAPVLRWARLYGPTPAWFDLSDYPRLCRFAMRFETTAVARDASLAEGLGQTIFSNPSPATPPEGSPT